MLAFCPACALLQVTETIPADVLYRREYPYFSSKARAAVAGGAAANPTCPTKV
jgi:hypothetical protein